ncbi:MAG: sulfotransferase [Pseudomonadota bacterium]
MDIGLVATLFPHAIIVHHRRDPRDTCLSCYFQNFNASYPNWCVEWDCPAATIAQRPRQARRNREGPGIRARFPSSGFRQWRTRARLLNRSSVPIGTGEYSFR